MTEPMASSKALSIVSAVVKPVTLALGVVVLSLLTIWFDDKDIAEEGELLTDLSVLLLGMVSLAALFRAAGSETWERRLWFLVSGAFVFLALDDYLLIHERIDKRIHKIFQIRETQFTDALDSVIVLLYGVAAIAVVAVFRHFLKQYPGSFAYLGVAFFFLLSTIVLDLVYIDVPINNAYLEESCKVLSEYFFLLAFVMPARRNRPLRIYGTGH